jgi:hypothetical protein
MDDDSYPKKIMFEASEAKTWLSEIAMSIFYDLENSIKSDHGRTPRSSLMGGTWCRK